jgi:DNA-binding NarL/FixJ family response regulator
MSIGTVTENASSSPASRQQDQSGGGPRIVVIEARALMRECLAGCFITAFGPELTAYAKVEDWIAAEGPKDSPHIVVLSTGGHEQDAEAVQKDVQLLTNLTVPLTLIMLADAEEPDRILKALEQGARGYIPTSSSLAIAIEAVRLVHAGGVYIPAKSLIAAANRTRASSGSPSLPGDDMFTDRQILVLEALSKGKANKAIAHELKIHESTVKVHIRNIMRKLGAKNRTEVAYISRNPLFSSRRS